MDIWFSLQLPFRYKKKTSPCIHIGNKGYIRNGFYEVYPDTIGQFTGITDCNGKEIYEGDILVYGGEFKHVVEFKHGMFGYTLMDGGFIGYGGNPNFTFNPLDRSNEHEIVGNVFDNPDLIPNQPTAI